MMAAAWAAVAVAALVAGGAFARVLLKLLYEIHDNTSASIRLTEAVGLIAGRVERLEAARRKGA